MLFYLQQCIKRCIPNTLKNIVRHNRFYTEYILPWRLNYQQKKVAKLDDETFLTMRHKHIFGYIPNFKNPQTFNEKIVHRMLYDRNPIYSALADKLKARIYIATCLQELQNTANISHTSNISATMSNATISINTMGGGQSKSNALDSKHSNLSDSVSYSNHLESLHKVDSATFNSNSLDSLNSNYSNLSNSNSLDSSFNSKQTQYNSKLDSKYSNHLESLHKVDSATFNSNSLDSLNSNYSNYSNLSNHLDSKNLDSVSNLSDSNSLDSINLHSIDSATLSLLFMPIDDIQDKLFETNTCEFLPKIYGIYKNVEEIDFTLLPQSFVLKTNHDCGGVVLVQDKDEFLNNKKVFQESMDKLRKHLNTNYYTKTREWHYDSIEPRVFVEEMLCEVKGGKIIIPNDYKFHCFGDKIFSETIIDRGIDTRCTFFDENWNPIKVKITYDFAQKPIEKPKVLPLMLEISRKFSKDLGYLRCDFYLQNNEILHIGELTFTPGGGTLPISPREYDKKLGDLWKIKA